MGYPITPEGLADVKRELDYLQAVKRPEVVKAISDAREHGDLKENAEYAAAKEEQALLEARISQLDQISKSAEVIDVKNYTNDGRVIFGSTVCLKACEGEQSLTMRIVGEIEADFSKGTVSVHAPLVKACLGRSVGDFVEFSRGQEVLCYEIVSVTY